MPRPSWIPQAGPALCGSLRNRNAHQHFTKDIRRASLDGTLEVKFHRPKWAQNVDEDLVTYSASLRSRNACQDFTRVTRATSYGNLEVKCRRPAWAPWLSTGLYTYRKNPSVWTHCVGQWKDLFPSPMDPATLSAQLVTSALHVVGYWHSPSLEWIDDLCICQLCWNLSGESSITLLLGLSYLNMVCLQLKR